jgi:hypothetical protein
MTSGHNTFFVAYIAGALLLLTTLTVIYSTYSERRLAELKSSLESRGFSIERTQDGNPLHYRPEKERHALQVEFSASGRLGRRPARVTEYSFDVGHGRSVTTYTALEVAVECSADCLDFIIKPRLGIARRPISKIFADPPAAFGNLAFSKRWDVECASHAFASHLLTQDMQTWLATAPSSEKYWRLRDGWLSCTWYLECNAKDFEQIIERLEMFIHQAGRSRSVVSV